MTPTRSTAETLVVVLGDQLSQSISSLRNSDKTTSLVLMAEVTGEATYVRHHKKKLALVFSAMRHFAKDLKKQGWKVEYIKIDQTDNSGTLAGEIERAASDNKLHKITVTEPGEWRLLQEFEELSDKLHADSGTEVTILEDDRFICSQDEFENWAAKRKQLRMENFYHEMRRKTNLLMHGDKPVGDKWNYDSENRKAAPKSATFVPPRQFKPDTISKSVIKTVEKLFGEHFGELEPFWFATTADEAEAAFEHWIETGLPTFGDYQDAMLNEERFLSHSVLAAYINLGLLDPLLVCQRVEAEYLAGNAPLNAAEGFIRQIIGWREYVRGIYWLKMPDYVEENYFNHQQDLPEFYWTAETDMNCLKQAILQTRDEAYAHHIQRLMVTGNFAMLIGVNPQQLHEWYLMVYADAYEWVELPNTLGMSQFADGGLLGSKPYAAGGNYINKMSDYCKSCRYKISRKTGEDACPFNYLYWHFLDRNSDKLRTNHRLAQTYATLNRMSEERREEINLDAKNFISSIS